MSDPNDGPPLENGTNCACGQSPPWHLVSLGAEMGKPGECALKHTCSCGRHYHAIDGKLVPKGYQENPFARF